MIPFSKQYSTPLGARLEESKVFIQPSISSSSLPPSLSSSPAAALNNRNNNGNNNRTGRARSILALALTLLTLILIAVASTGSSSSNEPAEKAKPASSFSSRLSSSLSYSASSSSSTAVPRRRPLPSSSLISAALASADDSGNAISDSGFPLAVLRKPLLTSAELLTLQHYSRGSVYAEWGSGASTVLAAPLARRAVSIENQKSWCDEMLASADVDFWIQNNVLTYLCVDTGATGRFGTPTGESDPRLFGNYLAALDEAAAAVTFGSSSSSSMSPKKKGSSLSTRLALSGASSSSSSSSAAAAESKEEEKELKTSSTDAFTLVLVDGRFRVACALKALWHLDHARGVLLVHDWLARSAQYHDPILKRYTLLAVVDRLAVLAPSSPPSPTSTMEGESSGDENDDDEAAEEARVRWWREAAEEMDKYSRDAA